MMLKNSLRALRLPFITASIFPFIFGSMVSRVDFNMIGFLLGLAAVIATHLSANLINDYADSQSGADWHDTTFYQFFGGSKLIQERVLPESFYLFSALGFAAAAWTCIIALAVVLGRFSVIGIYAVIIFLSWSYSEKPFQFSYHRLGEFFIFFLFGPALVMGGYFIQTGIFPDIKSFMLSVPFGLLTTAILFVNEVPDFSDDVKSRKMTWVSLVGPQQAFVIYYLLIGLAFLMVLGNIVLGFLSGWAVLSLPVIFLGYQAGLILKKAPGDKVVLVGAAKKTIALQTMVSLILILTEIL